MKHSSAYLPIQFFIIRASERKAATQHRVQQHAQRPYISGRARILDFRDDLRRHVGRSPTEYFNLPIIRNAGTESKIDNFQALAARIE